MTTNYTTADGANLNLDQILNDLRVTVCRYTLANELQTAAKKLAQSDYEKFTDALRRKMQWEENREIIPVIEVIIN